MVLVWINISKLTCLVKSENFTNKLPRTYEKSGSLNVRISLLIFNQTKKLQASFECHIIPTKDAISLALNIQLNALPTVCGLVATRLLHLES